jgi:dihydrofolate reductase
MGRLVVNNAMSVNGAFEAPQPPPGGWLVLDDDSNRVSLDQFLVADAMVLGRKTYEGLAAVWPTLADDPNLGVFAGPVRLELIGSTTFPSGVVRLAYRPAPHGQESTG